MAGVRTWRKLYLACRPMRYQSISANDKYTRRTIEVDGLGVGVALYIVENVPEEDRISGF